MNTTETRSGTPPQVLADLDAVMEHFLDRTPIDPILAHRISERSRLIQQGLKERFDTDLAVDLLREVRDEQ